MVTDSFKHGKHIYHILAGSLMIGLIIIIISLLQYVHGDLMIAFKYVIEFHNYSDTYRTVSPPFMALMHCYHYYKVLIINIHEMM